MKKTIVFILLFSISMPLILLMTNIEIATFDLSFYEKKYNEYDIPKETSIEMNNLMNITSEMLDYLKGKREDLIMFTEVNGNREQVFEEREILHMVDVKDLFIKGYRIRTTMIFIFIISIIGLIRFNKKSIGKALIITTLWPMILMSVLVLLIYIDFNKYFTYFHEIFFTNDLWLLDPKTDILIQMLPLDFFYSIAFKILMLFIIELIVLLVLGVFYSKKSSIIKNP